MNRPEKRSLKKSITKRLEVLEKSTLLKDKSLVDLPDEEKKLLAENNHPDKELQRKFHLTHELLKEMVDLQGQLVGLSLNKRKEPL